MTEKTPAKPALHQLVEKAIENGAFADFYKALPILERLIEDSRNAGAAEAYEDAARVVLEPRTGIARHVATSIASRIHARKDDLGEAGAGAFDHERAFRVYRDTGAGATAVPSMNHVGRGGLLTLEEALKVRAASPNTWIGMMPPVSAPRSAILRVEV
jgi:hypothetical protein